MGRPSKLTTEQWRDVEMRLAAGEGVVDLAREYGVSHAAISHRVSNGGRAVRMAAQTVAEAADTREVADALIGALEPYQREMAMTLADQLRGISTDVAHAAADGARTGRRLHALARVQAERMQVGGDIEELRTVGALAKIGNEALSPALALLAAHRSEAPAPVEEIEIVRSYAQLKRPEGA